MATSSKYNDTGVQPVLPYRVRANFKALFDYWNTLAESENPLEAGRAKDVLDRVGHAKELFSPFEDVSLLEKYRDEIALLSSPLFPEMLQTNEIKALTIPFIMNFFQTTKRLESILIRGDGRITGAIDELSEDEMYQFASVFVLNMYYKAGIDLNKPMFLTIPDAETGIERKYRTMINADHVKVDRCDDTPELTQDEIRHLVDNFDDIDLWREKLPPNSYSFEGFGLISLFDVTTDIALTSIKHMLLYKDVMKSSEQMDEIERQLRAYFNTPDIELSIGIMEMDGNWVLPLRSRDWKCQGEGDMRMSAEDCFCNYSYKELFVNDHTLINSNIDASPGDQSVFVKRMRRNGVKSYIVHPIDQGRRFKGFLEITSKKPYVVNAAIASKLRDLIPMFNVAFERGVDDYESQIEAIVQNEFTAIHPSVAWKFYDVAEQFLVARTKGAVEVEDEIVFNEVIPLYGQFDVRGSSAARNAAIQSDLIRQLDEAEKVFDVANGNNKLPLYDQLKFRIQKWRKDLVKGIGAGDEVKILDLLQTEIYPVFNHVAEQDENVREAVKAYKALLDPELMVIYDKRKKYEDSITIINETIQEVVVQHQVKAQEMFPHYFEKYKTDGVEYNLYIGQAIAPRRSFDPLYVRNLRLWQIMLAHAVEARHHSMKTDLPMPLDISSLILAHDAPLAIKFRMDETKFDVDGAYNVRYEILKKRIDKARIKGTDERITKPGTLTVVYSNEAEAAEYEKYFEYLIDLGMFKDNVERHELEDLQGITGLEALRLEFSYDVEPSVEPALKAITGTEAL